MNTAQRSESGSLVAVTVTYGARWHLLRQMLASARSEGCDRVVVVDNGSTQPIATSAHEEFGDFVDVVTLPCNLGSAGGYKAALAHALSIGAAYVLLMDDDNALDVGALSKLVESHARWSTKQSRDGLAVQAYRDRLYDLATGMPSRGMYGDNPEAFFGFHWLDVPAKLVRRLTLAQRWKTPRKVRGEALIHNGPYGGMFFHADVLRRHGLPDERFILYVDDTEFSARITQGGGRIVLVSDARLRDLELSFNDVARFGNSFDGRLVGDDDFRAYYWTRNTAWYERNRLQARGFVRLVNRALFHALLWTRAVAMHRLARYRLVRQAIRDGEAGRLGEHPAFPLA